MYIRFRFQDFSIYYRSHLDNEYDARVWKGTHRLTGDGMPPIYNPRRLAEQPMPIMLENNEVPNQQEVIEAGGDVVLPLDLDAEVVPFQHLNRNLVHAPIERQHLPVILEHDAAPYN